MKMKHKVGHSVFMMNVIFLLLLIILTTNGQFLLFIQNSNMNPSQLWADNLVLLVGNKLSMLLEMNRNNLDIVLLN
jgi:hypothetical protein